MSYTDDEIDKIFREAGLNQKTPVFNDSFFDEVEALLPKKRNKKGIFWIFGSILTLIIGIGTFVGFNYSKTQIAKSNSHTKTSEIAVNMNKQSNTSNLLNELSSTNDISTIQNTTNENHQVENENSFTNSSLKSSNKFKKLDVNNTEYLAKNDTEQLEVENSKLVFVEPKITDEIGDNSLEDSEFGNLAQGDYSLIQTMGELLSNPFPIKTNRLFLSAELGSGFSENFLVSVPAIGKPVFLNTLGLNLEYKFKKFNLSAGLHYSNYQTHDLKLNRSSKVYGFEVTKYNQTIDYKWISTLQLPISIRKEFGNHSLAFGIDPSLVLGSCVDFRKNENDIIVDDSRYYSNMIGLKRFYLGAHISYDLKFAKDYAFGIKISNQLINPLDMSKFEGTSNKNPFQAQLTIKKYFKLK